MLINVICTCKPRVRVRVIGNTNTSKVIIELICLVSDGCKKDTVNSNNSTDVVTMRNATIDIAIENT